MSGPAHDDDGPAGAGPTGNGSTHERLREVLRPPFAALLFLTRIPCPAWVGGEPAHLARSTAYFPLVGAVVGVAGAVVYAMAMRAWNPFVAATLAIATTAWITGAFHEDALADAFDGFGGGWERAQVLAIMKDSRIGSYGAVGLTLVLLGRVGALTLLGASGVGAGVGALIAAHVLGRWSSLPLIRYLPYVSGDGARSRPFAASVTAGRLAAGTLLAVGIVAVVLAARGGTVVATVLACVLLVTLGAGRYFRDRLGGMTGDCLGAANQLVELVTYLALASAWLRP